MDNALLWKKLTPTDFNAMSGQAQQSGTGGGAMHIALGVNRDDSFPIKDFLDTTLSKTVVKTEPLVPAFGASKLTFDGNPARRGGEWRINDQFSHRHPAWNAANGFPGSYDKTNRPVVLVAKVRGKYHPRLLFESSLGGLPPSLANTLQNSKGIVPIEPAWEPSLNVPPAPTVLDAYEEIRAEKETDRSDEYSPDDQEDGRKRTLAEVVRRQGQQSFRRKLIKAYESRCAITGATVKVTLQAAHITPYLGPRTNHVSNGMLLRADVHTLFDLGLISVDPATNTILVSHTLDGTEYAILAGKTIHLPPVAGNRPSIKALEEHRKAFQP